MLTLLARRSAQQLLKDYYITKYEHFDLIKIIHQKKINIEEKNLEIAEAKFQPIGNAGVIILNSKIKETGQKNFALAHELGHFELHNKEKLNRVCETRDLTTFNNNDIETEANIFAAELLMPDFFFKDDCVGKLPDLKNISDLAKKYNTSLMATAFRFVEIGSHPSALVISVDGKIKWYTKSSDFQDKIIQVGYKVNKCSCIGDFIVNGISVPNDFQKVGSFCWIENSKPEDQQTIYEHSIFMPYYNTAISMLWYD